MNPTNITEEMHRDDLVPSLPPSENKRFYPALDGVRALAVLMVFWHHYSSGIPAAGTPFHWGWAGVDIFFVLSGFLITGILYDTRDRAHRFRTFYARRTLRIFPLFYGVLLVGLLLTPIFHWVWHPAWILWPLYLGNFARFLWPHDFQVMPMAIDHLLSSVSPSPLVLFFGHFWSLCVEEQFYLVWPLVVFSIRDRVRLRNLCVAVWVLCLLARTLCYLTLPRTMINAGFLERFTPLRVDALLLGGFLALCLRGPEANRLARLARVATRGVLALWLVLEAASLLRTHRPLTADLGTGIVETVGYSVIDLLAAVLLLRALQPGTLIFRLFCLRPLRRLGQMSYGFYVFHDIPHVLYDSVVYRLAPSKHHLTFPTMVVAFCGTLLLSYLSFRFYETPFLRLKDRFTA